MPKSFLFIVLLFLYPCISSEILLNFKHYSPSDGLSESSVDCIIQDDQGYLWFGTPTNGLNRFDGNVFSTYKYNQHDSTSLSGNIISAIYEDSQGNLWIGTMGGGLNLYNRDLNNFTRIKNPIRDHSYFEYDIKFIVDENTDRMWVGFHNKLELYDREENRFIPHRDWNKIVKFIGDFTISFLYLDHIGLLWIGTRTKGLIALDIEAGTSRHYENYKNDPNSLSHNHIWTITEDTFNNLWIGTFGGGLNLFDREKEIFYRFQNNPQDVNSIGSDNICALMVDCDNTLWIGTENSGLNKLCIDSSQSIEKKYTFQKYLYDKDNNNSLSSNNVRSIYQDKQGNYWIGTYKGGLNFSAKYVKPFEHFYCESYNEKSLSNNLVNCIYEDSEGLIWISTDGGGLNLFDRQTNSFSSFKNSPNDPNSISHNHVISTCEDQDGNLWIGTWGGLDKLDKKKKSFIHIKHDPKDEKNTLCSNNINHIMCDSRNLLWICTYSGLDVLDLVQNKYYHILVDSTNRLSNSDIRTAFEDSNSRIWIGTPQGLHVIEKKNILSRKFVFKHYLDGKNPLGDHNGKVIYNIFESQKQEIWVATEEGLFRYSSVADSFVSFTVKDGLPSDGIMAILEDDGGNLWISTLNGLSKFNPHNQKFINYVASDGLQSNEFYVGACKSSSGELYFGGINGFTVFNPRNIKQNLEPPAVVITDFFINHKSVSMGNFFKNPERNESSQSYIPILEIQPEYNAFSFEFAALDYTNPKKHQYEFRLEGFDKDWNETDANRRLVTYTGLPAGSYTFHVRGSNSDGIWNKDGTSIDVEVIPIFLKSTWALVLYIIVGLGILILLRRIIIAKIRYDAEIDLDEMKLDFFTNVTHEFKTPLTLIMGPIDKLLHADKEFVTREFDRYLQIIFRNSQRLLRLINQIMDVQKIDKGKMELNTSQIDIVQFVKEIFLSFNYLAESRNIEFQFKTNKKKINTNFDPEKLDKVIYNLISNAFKYTKNGGKIVISLSIFESCDDARSYLIDKTTIKLNQSDWSTEKLFLISIKDTGEGIPEKQLEHIFDLFYRGENNRASGQQGTGIGLALTKELVNLHQGQIYVDSQKNKGTEFTVILPLDDSSFEISQNDQSYIHLESDDQSNLDLYLSSEIADVNLLTDSELVLIVEDDIDMRSFIRDQLKDKYSIVEASNGKEGLIKANELIPDLIISDVMMPELDGYQFCKQIKDDEKTSHIPVIILTAKSEESEQIMGFDFGADAYIIKPFKPSILSARIENLMHSRKELQEHFKKEILLGPQHTIGTPSATKFVEKLMEIVNKQISESSFGVDSLAYEIGMSRSQLYRKINSITGQTPREFITSLRLKKAMQLLDDHNLTIAEISCQTGFSDPAYFSNCFKKKFGKRPSEYAKQI